ncbi:hypothetical protein ACFS32_02645 [Novosphingobium pokkalii]|uniref:hypothetical protein n=1 Tax=Novosphingobium pokkalii TaxID=1770194 RepID=UPI003635325E
MPITSNALGHTSSAWLGVVPRQVARRALSSLRAASGCRRGCLAAAGVEIWSPARAGPDGRFLAPGLVVEPEPVGITPW